MRRPRLEEAAEEATASIVRVAGQLDDVDVIDAIAAASFTDYGFSVEEEMSRPWARIWIAREEPAGARAPAPRDEPQASQAPPSGEATRAVPIGFLVSWHVADELHVLNIATAPRMRRRGIATAMMNEALRYAASHRVRIVLLEVRRSNRAALRLYRQLGFTAMGIRPGYYSDNGEDAIEMVLGLDPETGRFLPGRDEIRIDV